MLCLEKWREARSALVVAKNKGIDIVANFHKHYKSIDDFEDDNEVELPDDIVEMLDP